MEAEEDFPRSSEVVLEPLGEPRRRNRVTSDGNTATTFIAAPKAKRSVEPTSSLTRCQLPTLENLEVGSLVLGSVAVVTPSGLRVHLPNGLVGFVRASDVVDIPETQRCRPEAVVPSSINVGSHVVCSVLEVKRSYVSLSMRPSVINKGLTLVSLTSGMLLPASVRSHEDHGILLTFHLGDSGDVRGFVKYDDDVKASKETDASKSRSGKNKKSMKNNGRGVKTAIVPGSPRNLPLHSTVYVVVDSVSLARQLVTCKWPWRHDLPVSLDCTIPLLCIRPGLLLVGEISDIHIPASSQSVSAESRTNYGFDLKCLNGLGAIVPAVHSVVNYSHPFSKIPEKAAESDSDDEPAEGSVDTSLKKNRITKASTFQSILSYDPLGVEDCVVGRVLYVNHWNKTIYVSVLSHVLKWKGPQGHPHRLISNTLKTFGKVLRTIPGHGVVFSLCRLRENKQLESDYSPESLSFNETDIGFCEFSQLYDDSKGSDDGSRGISAPQLALSFGSGTVHPAIELEFDFLTRFVRLSTRPSLQDETLVSPFQLIGGHSIKGVITKVGSSGVNVRLSKLVQGKVPLEHLTDVPPSEVPEQFVVGGTLKLRVLRFDHVHSMLLLTAKRGMRKDPSPLLNFNQLSIGKEFSGYVCRMRKTSDNSSGVAAKKRDIVTVRFYNDLQSTLDPHELAEAERLSLDLSHGALVSVVITRIDHRRRCFYVTLSPDKVSSFKALATVRRKRRRDARRAACKKAFTNYVSSLLGFSYTAAVAMASSSKSAKRRISSKKANRKSVDSKIATDNGVASTEEPVGWDLGEDILSHLAPPVAKTVSSEPSEDATGSKKKKRRRTGTPEFDSARELAKETDIREAERRLAAAESSGAPDSVFEFEKKVATGGNSASIWMEYMAFHLKNGSLEAARQVVRRGLERIDFRALHERQTLWVAYINMECLFGDRVKEVFRESLRFNNPKTMYIKMLHIFVKNNRLEDAVEVCEQAIKKFGKSKKIWNAYLRLLFEHVNDFEAARKVYERCLLRIPSHKKVYMITSTALLEFKHASADRYVSSPWQKLTSRSAQMMFENLLLENPRRMDVWMQYICAYIKYQLETSGRKRSEALRAIRNLFQRIITLDLKPKKMKVIYQKWMEFECTHGDEKSTAVVQQKAMEYVEAIEARLKP
ncbi:Protein RRP5 -like protein [Babesia sp. Xinjiang]|uniref:Protein RRP5 -like protein n=1 Tax=Babesia sp. Xinjiang TaxID=462227 RepID=UPI000A235A45|nr:Protein RRP5 -like protein [Babesia sp. Xinjiang]ORM39700.1 Protein RRP5 -like protein [Babesia sp. Xinjiang]